MRKNFKWLLPVTAAFGLMVGAASLVHAQDAAKPATGTVEGTVLDKDGKAADGVEVRLMKPFRRGGPGGGGQRGPGGPGGGGAGGEGRGPANNAAIGTPGARQLQDAPPPQGRPAPVATATTDKDGKFTMKDVPVGDYTVGVRDQDKKLFGRADVKVEEGKTATVEIKCTDTPPARGGGRGPGGPGGGGGAGGQRPGGGAGQ